MRRWTFLVLVLAGCQAPGQPAPAAVRGEAPSQPTRPTEADGQPTPTAVAARLPWRDGSQSTHLVAVTQHSLWFRDTHARWDGSYTNDAFGAHVGIGVAPGVIGLFVARAGGRIPLFFELSTAPPGLGDLQDYDAVLEASVTLASHELVVESEAGVQARIPLPKKRSQWRLRAYHANASSARYDYVDGAEHIRLVLFAGEPGPVVIHKRNTSTTDDPDGVYRGKRSLNELRAMLAGRSSSHQCLAVVALVQLGVFCPVEIAAGKSLLVRRVFASALALAGPAAVEHLRKLVADPDDDVRLRVAQSLDVLGVPAGRPLLRQLMHDKNRAVQGTAKHALDVLAEQSR